MEYCCDRLDHVLGKIVEGLWNFGLEKLLSAHNLVSYYNIILRAALSWWKPGL